MNDKRPFCRRWGTAVSAVGVEGIAWAHRAFENKPAAYRHSPKPLNTSQSVSVFEWFETDGLISQRRDWLIGFKV